MHQPGELRELLRACFAPRAKSPACSGPNQAASPRPAPDWNRLSCRSGTLPCCGPAGRALRRCSAERLAPARQRAEPPALRSRKAGRVPPTVRPRPAGAAARRWPTVNSCAAAAPRTQQAAHDWLECPYAHRGEKAARRDPRTHSHVAVICPDIRRSGRCPRGDSCPYAHSVFELHLHPSRYRTSLCTMGASCKRPVCFFAHSVQEMRAAPAPAPAGSDEGDALVAPPPAGGPGAAAPRGF
ncbi:MAG: hypothetical protein J3K34DRAFT_34237, partial [Monoraphidium minutum]